MNYLRLFRFQKKTRPGAFSLMFRMISFGLLLFAWLPFVVIAQTVPDSFEIRPGRAGAIVVGMSVDSLYTTVGRQRTRLVDHFWEGSFDPAIEVRLERASSKPSIVAKIGASSCGFTVRMLLVHDPRYRLTSGLHVGSKLGEIRKHHRVRISYEEGLRAYSPELDMAFEINNESDSAIVSSIWVMSPPTSPTCER